MPVRLHFIFILTLLLLTHPVSGAPNPQFVELYPNPIQYNDHGEYLIVEFPHPTNLTDWSISDGKTTINLPNKTRTGLVLITTDPAHLPPWITTPPLTIKGTLRLANVGDTLTLYHNTTPIDTVTYTNAPEGSRYHNTSTGWRWQRPDTTNFTIATATNLTGTAISFPDNSKHLYEHIKTATTRIYIGAYTYGSLELTQILCTAATRGVTIHLLADASPVGGMTHTQKTALDRLASCNATITMIGGDYARYNFHHPKYAIIDDTAIILTENWKPSGTGGQSSRGWGIILHDPTIVHALHTVFNNDATGHDTRNWHEVRDERQFVPIDPPTGPYPAQFSPQTHPIDTAELLIAPDNAEAAITTKLTHARESILIQQVSISNSHQPFMNATIHAAHRGVDVTILLSNAWYVRDDNTAFAAWLTNYARTHDLPIKIALAPPQPSFEKIHTKGVIIDDTTVILGSINWNNHSVRQNREIAIAIDSPPIAAHYTSIYFTDWRGTPWTLPIGFLAVTITAITGAGMLVLRTVTMNPPTDA